MFTIAAAVAGLRGMGCALALRGCGARRVRWSSTAAAAHDAPGKRVSPTSIKWCLDGRWTSLDLPWAAVHGMSARTFLARMPPVDDGATVAVVKEAAATDDAGLPTMEECTTAVEVGPGATLGSVARAHARTGKRLFLHVRRPSALLETAEIDTSRFWFPLYTALALVPGQPKDGCELLRSNRPWPCTRSVGLLVPPVYKEFYERPDMLNCFAPRRAGEAPVTLVRNTPGAGGTAFALYCLWRLAMAGRHVTFESAHLPGSVTFRPRQPHMHRVVRIVDGKAPSTTSDLLVASREHHYSEHQHHARTFYLPAPSVEEILLMRDTVYVGAKALTDDAVKARISKCGRVPRLVLGRTDAEFDAALARTIESNKPPHTELSNGRLYGGHSEGRYYRSFTPDALHYDPPLNRDGRPLNYEASKPTFASE